ncbi:MAG: hypothetical protein AAFP89_00580 [Bacteroidota bacterium]
MELFIYYLMLMVQPAVLVLGFIIILALHLHHKRRTEFHADDWGSGGIPVPVEVPGPDVLPTHQVIRP